MSNVLSTIYRMFPTIHCMAVRTVASRFSEDAQAIVSECPRCRWLWRGSGASVKSLSALLAIADGADGTRAAVTSSGCARFFARAFAFRRCRVRVYKSARSCPGDDVTAGDLTCCLQSAACRLSWRSDQTPSSTRSHTAPQTWSRLLQETHSQSLPSQTPFSCGQPPQSLEIYSLPPGDESHYHNLKKWNVFLELPSKWTRDSLLETLQQHTDSFTGWRSLRGSAHY